MEESIFKEIPAHKIYSDKLIWVGTFLGGPLVAGYFISENYKAFGEQQNVNRTWLATIMASTVIFLIIFLIPENINIPNFLFPLTYTAIVVAIVKKLQGEKMDTHIQLGGLFFGWGRTILASIIGLIVTFVGIFIIAFSIDYIQQPDNVVKQYGTLNHEIHYDPFNISEKDIDNIASAFTRANYFDRDFAKFVYAKKENNEYKLSLSITNDVLKESAIIQAYRKLHADIKREFPKNKIVFLLVVDSLDNVVMKIE
ncbi:hypothetical protein ACFPVY_13330 [Flavobacterium qiangtangense]|uniref:Uncharacterized protein n=1 Tax=Flavobacterium qiangtangense TaxID=1442595 RepID=A0ABW1PPP5_9FLAO